MHCTQNNRYAVPGQLSDPHGMTDMRRRYVRVALYQHPGSKEMLSVRGVQMTEHYSAFERLRA
jgi:hypothetical protein